MATWCVYHVIHVVTPHKYLPQLTIRYVPDAGFVSREMLERAGYQFGEFGIPWANHCIEAVDTQESPSDLIFRLRNDEGLWIDWDELQAMINDPL